MRGPLAMIATLVLLLAVQTDASGHSHTYSRNWRAWYSYNLTGGTEYMFHIRGKTCKDPYVDMVILNGASSAVTDDLKETAEFYMGIQYPALPLVSPWSSDCTTPNAVSATADPSLSGNCPLRQLKQDCGSTSGCAHEMKLGTLTQLSADNDMSKNVQRVRIMFNSSKSESCTNTVSGGDAHAGHNHRRSGRRSGHSHSGYSNHFSMQITAPATATYYFFADQDIVGGYEAVIHPEGHSDDLVTSQGHHVETDPNACSAATSTTTCNCDCDDEKYMWVGLIFAVGLLGMFPIFFQACVTNELMLRAMSLFNTFGGGALLGVAVGHVLPEAIDLYPSTKSDDYPAAAMLVAGGYWFMLVIDKVMLALCAGEEPADEPKDDGVQVNPVSGSVSKTEPPTEDAPPPPQENGDVESSSVHGVPTGMGSGAHSSGDVGVPMQQAGGHSCDSEGIHAHNPLGKNWLQAIGVFIAMAVHSVMAGFTLGLKCEKSSMENLAIAIVCHKIFDVTALGIVLVRAETHWLKALPFVFIVACMTPIGAIAGIEGEEVEHNTNGALQAIAAGTFLYVSIQEVLAHEFANNKDIILKAICTTLGIGMIGLASIAHTRGGHSH